MKKIYAPIAALALAACLQGCGSEENAAVPYAESEDADLGTAARGPEDGAPLARSKRTEISGSGDRFTVMVYMCGTDLESNYGAATMDILEMCEAGINDNVNLLLYTGGTSEWQNSAISPDTNQIWQVVQDDIVCVEEDMGARPMTDPSALSEFIAYCAKEYPAGRNALILWDHGGGALYGFGSDEIFGGGSMQLNELDSALESAGVKFDFIGFDACLMATVETACMADRHADYMIGSEATEPGSGWSYTGWLNLICEDPSVPTEDIGRRVIDDYIRTCREEEPGGEYTLSMTDLTEMGNVYEALCVFSEHAKAQLDRNNFRAVSHSVNDTKAFGDARYDSIDLMHFAQNFDIEGSEELIGAVKKAVIDSAGSQNTSNANGLAIYLPYNDIDSLERMLDVYGDIGLDGEYAEFIRNFANIMAGGQSYIGSNTPLDALEGGNEAGGLPDFSDWSGYSWFDADYVSGYEDSYVESGYGSDEELTVEERDGYFALTLSEEDWEIVNRIEMQLFYDDGGGYIDLGTDNYFDIDDDGSLMVDYDGLWFTLGGEAVPLYVSEKEDIVEGYIPCELNGEYVNLVVWWNDDGIGVIEGAKRFYDNGMSMKGLIPVEDGDVIQLLCDYYTYDGEYEDEYYLGDPFAYDSAMGIEYAPSGDGEYLLYYCLTDIYNNIYYVEPVALTFGG